MATCRIDRRQRAEALATTIQGLTFAETLDRLGVIAPADLKELEVLAKDLLRRRWAEQFQVASGA